MKPKPVPDHISKIISDHLKYDPGSGIITWKKKRAQCTKVGQAAGTPNGKYLYIQVSGRTLLAHRIAWFLYYGEWPVEYLDHKNGNTQDNRITNLRECTKAQNSANSVHRNSTTGFRNIGKRKDKEHSSKPFFVRVNRGGKDISTGHYYATLDEAMVARNTLLDSIDNEFALHLNRGE